MKSSADGGTKKFLNIFFPLPTPIFLASDAEKTLPAKTPFVCSSILLKSTLVDSLNFTPPSLLTNLPPGSNTYSTTITTITEVTPGVGVPAAVTVITPIAFTLPNNTPITISGSYTIDNQTLALNHVTKSFISKYSFNPSLYVRHNDLMFTIPSNLQETQNKIYIHENYIYIKRKFN